LTNRLQCCEASKANVNVKFHQNLFSHNITWLIKPDNPTVITMWLL
jgi:hypothetical protein